MRRYLLLLIAASSLVATGGCAIGGPHAILGPPPAPQWAAVLVQPTPPVNFTTSAPIFIVFELVPVNGTAPPPNVFFTDFANANPNLQLQCPGVITIGAGQLSTFGGAGVPAIALPITPVAPGSCNVPFFLGQTGIITVPIGVPQGFPTPTPIPFPTLAPTPSPTPSPTPT